jgi:hypothetical protein
MVQSNDPVVLPLVMLRLDSLSIQKKDFEAWSKPQGHFCCGCLLLMEGTILQHEDTLELPSTTDKSDGTRTGTELASSVSSTNERSAS